jgi:UDPglucose 6-dehydrogenase
VKRLRTEGAEIVAYDPVATQRAKALLADDSIGFAQSAYEVCDGAHALLVLTEWPDFAMMDWTRVQHLLKLPIVLDGKNLLDPVAVRSAGLHYFGVGISPEPLYLTQALPTDSAPENSA